MSGADDHHLRDLAGGGTGHDNAEFMEDLKKMLETVKHGGTVDFSVFTVDKLVEK